MTRLLRRLGTARRTAHRQDGVTLLVVMMITMVFGLIVVALLSATLTSIKVGSALSNQVAEQRAAAAAIETWIGQLKTSPAATGGCGNVTIPGATPVTVAVACSSTSPPAPTGPLGHTSMLLLGGYTYNLHDLENAQTFLNGWLSGFFGWLADMAGQNGPGFLHYGPEPLIVDTGDVVVRQQGLVWHEMTTGAISTPMAGPAVVLSDGRYVQRPVSWLFGNLTLPFIGTSPMCGLLDSAFRSWWPWPSDNGFEIAASGGLSCGQEPSTSTIFDDPGFPAPATFTSAAIRTGMGLSGTCEGRRLGATHVVAFDPGAYNRFDTEVLNDWFTGGCPDTTFWFRPGDYYFDAVGLVHGDPYSRSAIVFDDPTSNVVFGSPVGWTPGSSDRAPIGSRTCALNGAAPGVTITLSIRTTILHKAGFVSACSDFADDGAQRPLLYQMRSGPSERWIGKPTQGPGGVAASTGFVNPAYATGGAADPDTSEAPTAKSAVAYCTDWCITPSITFRGFSDAGNPAPYGAIQSATLRLRGGSWQTWGPLADRTQVDVTSADGTKTCTALEAGIGTDVDLWGVNVLEALQPTKCRDVFTEAIDYEGASIKVTYLPVRQWFCGWWVCGEHSTSLDYAWLDISTDNAQPGGTLETRVDPANGSQLTLFGPVYLPRTQVAVRWMGDSPDAQTDPIFTGGLVAQALLSGVDYEMTPNGKPGKLAGLNRVDGWTTSLRAVVEGHLRATAVVKIDNAASRPVTIKSWRSCDAPASASECPLPK